MKISKLMCYEDFKIFDSLLKSSNPLFNTLVKIYIHKDPNNIGDPVFEGTNLISGLGREFTAQKIFNLSSSTNNFLNYSINGFGIGNGGVSLSSGAPIIIDPTIDDVGLHSPLFLSNTYGVESGSSITGIVKPITTDGSIQLFSGGYGTSTYYSKVKCTCVINVNEPTNLGAGETVQISEAGLYFSNGSTNRLFSHICFMPKWKELESILTIEWYIIC